MIGMLTLRTDDIHLLILTYPYLCLCTLNSGDMSTKGFLNKAFFNTHRKPGQSSAATNVRAYLYGIKSDCCDNTNNVSPLDFRQPEDWAGCYGRLSFVLINHMKCLWNAMKITDRLFLFVSRFPEISQFEYSASRWPHQNKPLYKTVKASGTGHRLPASQRQVLQDQIEQPLRLTFTCKFTSQAVSDGHIQRTFVLISH